MKTISMQTDITNRNDIDIVIASLHQLSNQNIRLAIYQLYWNEDYNKDEISITIEKLEKRCQEKRNAN